MKNLTQVNYVLAGLCGRGCYTQSTRKGTC